MEVGGQCHALATVLQEDWYASCVGCGTWCSVWMGVENLRDMSLFVIILSDDCRSLSMWPHNAVCSTCHLAYLLHSFCMGWGIWSVNILWWKLWTACLITSHRTYSNIQSVSLLPVNEFESVCCSAVAVAPLLPLVVSIVHPGNSDTAAWSWALWYIYNVYHWW